MLSFIDYILTLLTLLTILIALGALSGLYRWFVLTAFKTIRKYINH